MKYVSNKAGNPSFSAHFLHSSPRCGTFTADLVALGVCQGSCYLWDSQDTQGPSMSCSVWVEAEGCDSQTASGLIMINLVLADLRLKLW